LTTLVSQQEEITSSLMDNITRWPEGWCNYHQVVYTVTRVMH